MSIGVAMKGKEPEEGELEGEKLEVNNEPSQYKPPPLVVNKGSEFFIAIGKQDIHSFVMLGVIKEDGTPQLLARVGKTGDVGNACLVTATIKAVGPGAPSRMQEEWIFGKTDKVIAYQAYAINYEQYKECLELISAMEKSQRKNPLIKNDAERDRIECYIPTRGSDKSKNEQVILKYRKLSRVKFSTEKYKICQKTPLKVSRNYISLILVEQHQLILLKRFWGLKRLFQSIFLLIQITIPCYVMAVQIKIHFIFFHHHRPQYWWVLMI